MSKKDRHNDQQAKGLDPNQVVRKRDGYKWFGLKSTQIDEKIKTGEIPAPISLSDSGRAAGWLGSQILEWQAQRVAAAKTAKAA